MIPIPYKSSVMDEYFWRLEEHMGRLIVGCLSAINLLEALHLSDYVRKAKGER
jgi:hypothetical protein